MSSKDSLSFGQFQDPFHRLLSLFFVGVWNKIFHTKTWDIGIASENIITTNHNHASRIVTRSLIYLH